MSMINGKNRFKFFILISFLAPSFLFAERARSQDIYYPFIEHILGESATSYKFLQKNQESFVIEAVGQNSASGLYTESPEDFLDSATQISWAWQVDEIQHNADISSKKTDDYAASLQFIFGEYGLFSSPKVLNYAWVGNDAEIGSVINSPRSPSDVRNIIVNNASSPLNKKIFHTRNLKEDFKMAYGEYPKEKLTAMGVFTDNDQTGEAVKATYYLEKNRGIQ